MKSEHYPSLELCKKLTEIGFPETEFRYTSADNFGYCEGYIIEKCKQGYKCPSVMEMLDVSMNQNRSGYIRISKNRDTDDYIWADCDFYIGSNLEKRFLMDTIPNALAEMILWLHENNYITFK